PSVECNAGSGADSTFDSPASNATGNLGLEIKAGETGGGGAVGPGGYVRIAMSPPQLLGTDEMPASPFSFLGNSPEKRRDTNASAASGNGSGDDVQRSTALALPAKGEVAAMGAGGEGDEFGGGSSGSNSSSGSGPIDAATELSGPQFGALWE
ncbi:unnamed protein product, partial [Sphacelaria rigidula]